jgi:hypothetical protein
MEALLSAGADINAANSKVTMKKKSVTLFGFLSTLLKGETPLFRAIQNTHLSLEISQALISRVSFASHQKRKENLKIFLISGCQHFLCHQTRLQYPPLCY